MAEPEDSSESPFEGSGESGGSSGRPRYPIPLMRREVTTNWEMSRLEYRLPARRGSAFFTLGIALAVLLLVVAAILWFIR